MVVGVVAHLLEVVVLAGDAETFLRVGYTAVLGGTVAEDDVLKLIHAGVGKHKGRVVLDYHRGRGYYTVSFLTKEFLERFTYFFCSLHIVE